MNAQAMLAAAKFFSLAAVAARNGGFWVSAGSGTGNCVAGEISRQTGVPFSEALCALETAGRQYFGTKYWYQSMADWGAGADDDGGDQWRWDARTIARAACRASAGNGEHSAIADHQMKVTTETSVVTFEGKGIDLDEYIEIDEDWP